MFKWDIWDAVSSFVHRTRIYTHAQLAFIVQENVQRKHTENALETKQKKIKRFERFTRTKERDREKKAQQQIPFAWADVNNAKIVFRLRLFDRMRATIAAATG